ncbi:hypothetical protein RRF57_000118 [Xylaria bambusicola]|uniref:Uncharacterized protein n=1 Tax=Xylaria bambusicola TaxID=326684 RepID=A0AAN7UBL6_9PEZI
MRGQGAHSGVFTHSYCTCTLSIVPNNKHKGPFPAQVLSVSVSNTTRFPCDDLTIELHHHSYNVLPQSGQLFMRTSKHNNVLLQIQRHTCLFAPANGTCRCSISLQPQGTLPPSGWGHWSNAVVMPQMSGYMGSPLYQGFNNTFRRNTPVPGPMRFNAQVCNMSDHDLRDRASARPVSAVGATMSNPRPLIPASSIPGVAKPASWDEYESNMPCMSGAVLLDTNIIEGPDICHRHLANHVCSIGGRTDQAYVQSDEAEDDDDSNNNENEDTSELMSESSSETNSALSHTADDGNSDAMDMENGSDGVIDLQAIADHNNPVGALSRGIDIHNSLRIDKSTGKFHLGSQWQPPSADAARMNAGPEFGTASTRTMSSYRYRRGDMMEAQDESGVDSHLLANRMGAIHLEDMDQVLCDTPPSSRFDDNAACYTETSPNRTGLMHRLPPMPVDLSMSGACRPGPSFRYKK